MLKRLTSITALIALLCCIVIPLTVPVGVNAEKTEMIEGLPIEPYSWSCSVLSSVEYDYEPEKIRADIHTKSSMSNTGSACVLTASMDAMEGYYPFIKECTITAYYRADPDSEVYPVTYTASGYGELGKSFSITARIFGAENDHIFLGATGVVDGWYEKGR